MKKYDLIVIGAGSGGLSVADKAAQYGKKCAVFEYKKIGGTCVNVGCVPKKVMWYAANASDMLKKVLPYTDIDNNKKLNWQEVKKVREQYISNIRDWYKNSFLTKTKNLDYIEKKATLVDEKTILADGIYYQADTIVLSPGSTPIIPDTKGAKYAIDSDGFFALDKLPKKVAIIGSGYIGIELAGVLNKLGSKVFLYHRSENILHNVEEFITKKLVKIMLKDGIVMQQAVINEITEDKTIISNKGNEKFDTIIWAIGRTPLTKDLGIEKLNIKVDKKGYIITDKFENTSIKNIYAIGDVNGKKSLTPVAIAAGRRLANRLFNNQKDLYLDYENIPTVIFSHPPIGSIGLTLEQAKKKYKKVKSYTASFSPMADWLWQDKSESSFILICAGDNQKVVGCHILDHHADEMLQGFAVAIKMGACKKDFDNTVAIHPTSAEELVTMV